jgi:hypothetical protein
MGRHFCARAPCSQEQEIAMPCPRSDLFSLLFLLTVSNAADAVDKEKLRRAMHLLMAVRK